MMTMLDEASVIGVHEERKRGFRGALKVND